MRRILSIGVLLFMISLTFSGCGAESATKHSGEPDNTDVVVVTTQTQESVLPSEEIVLLEPTGAVESEQNETLQSEIPQAVIVEFEAEEETGVDKADIDYSQAEPLSVKEYQGFELIWEVRPADKDIIFTTDQLKMVIKDRRIIAEYEYEGSNRVSKHVNGVTTYFTYDLRGQLLTSDDGEHKLEYKYSKTTLGKQTYTYPDSFIYNGEEYYLLYGSSGMIEGIEKDGEAVARYLYNGYEYVGTCKLNEEGVWELCADDEFIGNLNKLRHVAEYYDDETGWYFLGIRHFDPYYERCVEGISYDKYYDILQNYELGLPVEAKYDAYELSSMFCYDSKWDLSWVTAYSDINEPLVAARRGSDEWTCLYNTYQVKENYKEYSKENPDRRYTTPSFEITDDGIEEYVYRGSTQDGNKVVIRHEAVNGIEVTYKGETVTFGNYAFQSIENNIKSVEVYFYDMNKDGREEIVVLWDTILIIDLDTMTEVLYYERQEDNTTTKFTDEDAKALDDLLVKVVPEHKYRNADSMYYLDGAYSFAVEGDKLIYSREVMEADKFLRYSARMICEYDGAKFVKRYEMIATPNFISASGFEGNLKILVKTVYANLLNDMPGGKYEAYFGTVEVNKVWNIKVYYDNIDYDNYAIEIYDGETLVSRSFWKGVAETEVYSFLEEEYILLYEFDLTL